MYTHLLSHSLTNHCGPHLQGTPTAGLLRCEKAFINRQSMNVFAGLELFREVISVETEGMLVGAVAKMVGAGTQGKFAENAALKDTYVPPARTRFNIGRKVSSGCRVQCLTFLGLVHFTHARHTALEFRTLDDGQSDNQLIPRS